jgi:YjbE family integral membrane protein
MEAVESFVVFAEMLIVNLLLSGDNAIVIAMTGRKLPAAQRRSAVLWGALAAVLLRCALTAGAVALLNVPFLQAAGAVLLFAIALQLMLEPRARENTRSRPVHSLFGAIWTIVTADLVMSLDNVLAVAALADGDIALLVIGIVMSFPIILWGSSFIMRLLDRIPALVYIGGGLLGYTAGEMLHKDPGLAPVFARLPEQVPLSLPYALVAVLTLCALWLKSVRGTS